MALGWIPGIPRGGEVLWKHYCGQVQCGACPEDTKRLPFGQLPDGTTCACQADRNGQPLKAGQRVRIATYPKGTAEGILQASSFMCGDCHAPAYRVQASDQAYGPVTGRQILIL